MEKIKDSEMGSFFILGWGEVGGIGGNMGWQVEKLLLFIFVQVHAFVFWGWGGFQNNPPDHVHKITTSKQAPLKSENVFIIFLSVFACIIYYNMI